MAIVGKLFLSFFVVPFALGGGYLLKGTYDRRREASGLEASETTAVGELQPESGCTVIEGTARATGEKRVEAAMIDREGVYVYTQIEERSAREVGENTGPSWETVYTDSESVPFVIDDGTGEIPVEIPEQGATTLDPETYDADHGEEPPEPVRRWLQTIDSSPGNEVDPHRAYKQGVIEDGETVYAKGEPVGNGELVFTGDTQPEEFLLTDMSLDELAEQENVSIAASILGAVLLTIGLVGLAIIWVI
jgi:hypothetical protein